LGAAKAALAQLESSDAADVPAVAPLREAYTVRIERLEGIRSRAAEATDLTPKFWEATALVLAVERETLAAWRMEDQIDPAVADRADRDLAAEQADLAASSV
jgi:secreted protein with Ig-like and vWFA domain